MADLSKALAAATSALNTEITALNNFAKTLEANLKPALEIIIESKGHVVITGLGKSGLVGAKIAATLSSTGTPSFFLHSADALHGDSGALTPGDVLIALSGSGNSPNIVKALEIGNALGLLTFAILGFDGGKAKNLAQYPIHIPVQDLQIAEDLQLIIGHICMQWLCENQPNKINND
jgi:D-arabinose 5-phosphate isomerase GutQ